MRKSNRRGVKALAVLSFMAFTSCAIAGRGAFHLFTPSPQHAARTMQPTIRAERSHLSCGTGPRAPLSDVAQRGHSHKLLCYRSSSTSLWLRMVIAVLDGSTATKGRTGSCRPNVRPQILMLLEMPERRPARCGDIRHRGPVRGDHSEWRGLSPKR